MIDRAEQDDGPRGPAPAAPQRLSGVARWLHRIDVPTLVLWGDADRLVPFGQAAVWAAALPQARSRRTTS